MNNFNNQVVVITGAGSGMGRCYALELARQGAHLALCDVDTSGLHQTAEQVTTIVGKPPFYSVVDMANANAVAQFAQQVEELLGAVYLLINNAGIEGSARPVWATSAQEFERVMQVNYFGVVHGTRAFLPQMLRQERGAIVNVSSIFGLIGTPNHADYCASKFAVRGFTEALMVELKDTPIQVHLLHPGGIQTNITRHAHSQDFARRFFKTTPEQITKRLLQGIARNQPRIVYGHGAFKTWLGARLLPLRILLRLIYSELMPVIDQRDYPPKSYFDQQAMRPQERSTIRKLP
ncbi:MAG: SDR family NAD(P)-dependent oxidoreductase [Oleiphilaceae bacterium]|nr:SDR family NAD(P)-dependent oxidoreductase [Oleiphilaceae bacterium]